MSALEEAFLALPLDTLDGVALEQAQSRGCSDAEIRIEQIREQYLSLRDGEVEGTSDDVEVGVGIRVVIDGSMGFAATVELTPNAVAAAVDTAVDAARMSARARSRVVELAPEPVYGNVEFVSPFSVDPTSVSLADRVALLEGWSTALLGAGGVDHVSAALHGVNENKHLATLSGTVANQRRVRIHPTIEALALDGGDFESMRSVAPPVGRGYEYLSGDGWDFGDELANIPELLAAKLVAPSVEPGEYDLVIDPTNLWLTIHESVGHATELDRALGYEAAYAGTSFATFDQLGTLKYGSEMMHITGDRTTPYGLATIGYDDEGVKTQSFDLVRDGTLVGYQLDRQIARESGLGASNGCAFGCSPLMSPIQRMANVSLMHAGDDGPSVEELISGVKNGIYVVGDKSWSIDMQRYNFQFTGQRFFKIENGKIVSQLKDVAYQATTTEFWGSLVGLGGRSTYLLGGAMNCGKGQPGQVAPVSHGCPAALFAKVRVLNTKQESGR
jgi:TldD protein